MATKTRKLTVTMPDGKVGTRRTARDYTHVVIGEYDNVLAAERARQHLAEAQEREFRPYVPTWAANPEAPYYAEEAQRARHEEWIASLEARATSAEQLAAAEPTDWRIISWHQGPGNAAKGLDSANARNRKYRTCVTFRLVPVDA